MEELLSCDACDTLIDVNDCDFCTFKFCSNCMIKEKHNDGCFKCKTCNKYICSSFKVDNYPNVCFDCHTRAMLDKFGNQKDLILKSLDKMLEETSKEERIEIMNDTKSDLTKAIIEEMCENRNI